MLFHLLKDRVLFICLLLGSLLAGPVRVVRQDSVIHRAAGAWEDGTLMCDCPAHFTVAGLPEGLGVGGLCSREAVRRPSWPVGGPLSGSVDALDWCVVAWS